MKKIIVLLCLMAITTLLASDITPDTLWTKTFGGSGNDYAQSVQQTSEGGYIICGYTNSSGSGNQDAWIIKTDEQGDEVWNITLGESQNDYAMSIQQTSDLGYIIAGYTDSYGENLLDFYLIKTDVNGAEEWNNTYGGNGNDYAQSVQQTADGGYIIVGYTESYGTGGCDIWLIKTDSSGVEKWNKTFGGTDNDRAYSVQQTLDGGYIIAGATTRGGSSDIWLVKTDENGTEEWNQGYGEADFEEAFSVQQTAAGGYIIAGYSGPFTNLDAILIKTDSLGNEEWSYMYGGLDAEIIESVQQTADGGYVMAGLTQSYGEGLFDFWIVKTGSDGIEEWSKTMGGDDNDIAYSVQQTFDEGYVVAGCTSSCGASGTNCWFMKLENDGINENAGVRFDLDATTYGNQNLTTISNPGIGAYLRIDCYAINVHNLDTYEIEILYNEDVFEYVGSSATNPLTYEENILTTEGGTAIGWMVDTSVAGVLSIAYTLAGADTLEAPEGEGLLADIVFRVLSDVQDTLSFGTVDFYNTFGELDTITDKGEAIIESIVSVDGNEDEFHFEESKLNHYPNPVKNTVMIEYAFKDMIQTSPIEIEIYNSRGQLVDTAQGENGKALWNTEKHPNGIYFYKVNSNEQEIVKKMVVIN